MSSGTLKGPTRTSRAAAPALLSCTSPCSAMPTGDGVSLSAQARTGRWTYPLFAHAGFSVPEGKACWLPMFPAGARVTCLPATPPWTPHLPPCHQLSFRVPSPGTRNQTQEPQGPAAFLSEVGTHRSWPVEVAADYTLVSFMEHSRPLSCRPSQATDLQRDAFCVSASAHCRGSAPCAWLGQGPPGAP